MQHGMQRHPLIISSLIKHAESVAGDSEIVSRLVEAGTEFHTHRYTYTDAHRRCRQLASALVRMGISSSDLRARVRQGKPISYLVPECVEAYVAELGLYR